MKQTLTIVALVLFIACASDGRDFQRFFVVGNEIGRGVLEADPDERSLCYEAYLPGIKAAHLLDTEARGGHKLAVVTFFEPPGGYDPNKPCVRDVDTALMRDLIAHPDRFLVDVHRSEKAPAIELRLQLQGATS